MRIATWNVNSLKARLGKVEQWITMAQPDILCMQETKLSDAAFPALTFAGLGYETAHHGNGRWNGVAIASRIGLCDSRAGFGGDDDEADAGRYLSARCGPVTACSVYVPNGREVGSVHYEGKLAFLARLRDDVGSIASSGPVAVCGDLNVAPEDRDVWDISAFSGATHVSEAERAGFAALLDVGLTDAFRAVYPDTGNLFSWWDYRAGDFHKGRGMRIDHVLVSKELAGGVRYALIDREARKGMGGPYPPSDHAPLFVDIDLAPETSAAEAEVIGPASA